MAHESAAQPDVDATVLLNAAAGGDAIAAERLLPLVYEQLRRAAHVQMMGERAGHTLSATALVHEAYVRLIGGAEIRWQGRAHFLAVASEAMRRILVDRARSKARVRHGGGARRVDLDAVDPAATPEDERLLALDAALTRLADEHPSKAELVKLRHFGGLSVEEAAEVLGVSRATAYRQWEYARAWLLRAMAQDPQGEA